MIVTQLSSRSAPPPPLFPQPALSFCLACIFSTPSATPDFIHSRRPARPPALVVEIDFRQINYPPARWWPAEAAPSDHLQDDPPLGRCKPVLFQPTTAQPSTDDGGQNYRACRGGRLLPSRDCIWPVPGPALSHIRAVDYVRVYLYRQVWRVILDPSEVKSWHIGHVGKRAID